MPNQQKNKACKYKWRNNLGAPMHRTKPKSKKDLRFTGYSSCCSDVFSTFSFIILLVLVSSYFSIRQKILFHKGWQLWSKRIWIIICQPPTSKVSCAWKPNMNIFRNNTNYTFNISIFSIFEIENLLIIHFYVR